MLLIRRRPHRESLSPSRWESRRPLQSVSAVPVDLVETDDEILMSADLPGLKPDEIAVSVVGDRLKLEGTFATEQELERGRVHTRERYCGSFQRYLDLPASVDADAAQATFEKGVLKVELPKLKAAERKQIEVKRPFEEI